MYPYRVFVSYSRRDRELAEKVRDHLRKIGARPMADVGISPGTPFPEEIKRLISYAHMFVPILTKGSKLRPWVHQEIGYAMALGVPILPLALDELPKGLAEQLQALLVRPDMSDLSERLQRRNLEAVLSGSQEASSAMFQCADRLYQRTKMLVAYAKNVLRFGQAGRVRQRMAFTSFSLPNRHPDHPDWDKRDGAEKRSFADRELLRQEREVMEQHAREQGCDLIIDPYVVPRGHGGEATATRLRILTEFLESMPDEKARVVIKRGKVEGGQIIIGDWFAAEAVVPHYGGGYRQTIFTRHAPTVLNRLADFDREFEGLLADTKLGDRSSRAAAIETIGEIMKTQEQE